MAATRRPADYGLPQLAPLIAFGASPRAGIYLVQSARARAFLSGRAYVAPEDVKDLAPDILRHRVIPVSYTHLQRRPARPSSEGTISAPHQGQVGGRRGGRC